MSGRASSRSGFSSRSQRTTSASGFVRTAATNLPRTFSAERPYEVDSSVSGSSRPSATTSSPVTISSSLPFRCGGAREPEAAPRPGLIELLNELRVALPGDRGLLLPRRRDALGGADDHGVPLRADGGSRHGRCNGGRLRRAL